MTGSSVIVRPDNGDGIRVRFLTIEDRAQVENISQGIYSGFDYFLHEFERWTKSPYRYIFGIEVKKEDKDEYELAGLDCLSLLDFHRQTALMQAMRISSTQRGKGLSNILADTMINYAKNNMPGLKIIRATSLMDAQSTKTLFGRGFEMTTKRLNSFLLVPLLQPNSFELLQQQVALMESSQELSTIEKVSAEKLASIVEAIPNWKKQFLPQEIPVINTFWVPYDFHLENLKKLENDPLDSPHEFFVEWTKSPKRQLNGEEIVGEYEETLKSFALVAEYETMNGPGLTLTVYTKDFGSYCNQFKHYVKIAEKRNQDSSKKKLGFLYSFGDPDIEDRIHNMIQTEGLLKMCMSFFNKYME